MNISRSVLRAAVEDGVYHADSYLTDEAANALRAVAETADRVMVGRYTDPLGGCGCPLAQAGFVDAAGVITDEGFEAGLAYGQPTSQFTSNFDGHITAGLGIRPGAGIYRGVVTVTS